MPQKVCFLHSGLTGAPAANTNVLGGLLAVLDACLVNGFNTVSVTSVTRVGSVVTVVTSTPHNFPVGFTVQIQGATPADYNDRWRVESVVDATTFTFNITGTPTTPATGTISAQFAPLGWTKPVAGTNTAIYRNDATEGLGHYLQVEDNNPHANSNQSVRVRGGIALTALDTGTLLTDQIQWNKSPSGSTHTWMLIGDNRRFYVILGQPAADSTLIRSHVLSHGAGDLSQAYSGDTNAFFVSKGTTAAPGWSDIFPWAAGFQNNASSYAQVFLLRTYTGLGTPVHAVTSSASPYTYYYQNGIFPSPLDNTVPMFPAACFEIPLPGNPTDANNGGGIYRGMIPGVLMPVCGAPFSLYNSQGFYFLDPTVVGGVTKRTVLMRYAGNVNARCLAFDLGPTWD
jgi:hypothetical protein